MGYNGDSLPYCSKMPDLACLEQLHTLRDFIRWGASRFNAARLHFGHGTENALDDAVALVLNALHLPYDLPDFYLESRLTLEEKQQVVERFQQRIETRKPAAYLTHEAMFCGLPFYVDERVLVPRSPIAELIRQGFSPWSDTLQIDRILDLCTGSGCIAIACAYAFPGAEVDAVDISTEALEVAAINIRRHGLENRVHAIHADLFESLGEQRYELIVSNPPYVSQREWERLPPEYHKEPSLGLTSGQEGLDCAIAILQQAGRHLTEHGILVVEVGGSAEALSSRFPQIPFRWLEFSEGGEGVFLFTAEELLQYQADFATA